MRMFFDRLLGRRGAGGLPVEGRAPELTGLTGWANGEPATLAALRGRVVLLDFWTFSCINCLRTLPHVQAWHEAYGAHGLTVLGIHTPEFSFEHDEANVRHAVARHGLTYPVALDSDYATWKAYGNRYWPAHYFIDGEGDIRAHHFGEGGYEESERTIRALLTEAGHDLTRVAPVSPAISDRAPAATELTPETYLGWDRLEYLGSAETVRVGQAQDYSSPPQPSLNIFYLEGRWTIANEYAESAAPDASIIYRCRAANVFLVADGPVGYGLDISVDGETLPEEHFGSDATSKNGHAVVALDGGRLYHLVAAPSVRDMTLKVTSRNPGLRAYAFTFG